MQADLGGGSGNFDKEEREEFKRENPDAPDWLFHDGGLVTKHGPDEVPALLQTGEYVIPREGVRVKGGNNDDEGPVTIVVELDGRQIARGTMPHLEREIRLKTGVTY